MATNYAYLGHVQRKHRSRERELPLAVGLDLDKVGEHMLEQRILTGGDVRLVEVDPSEPALWSDNPTTPRPVFGTWVDELGRPAYGMVPAREPERWSRRKVRRFRKLALRFPEMIDAPTSRLPLADTLPKPSISRRGQNEIFLLFSSRLSSDSLDMPEYRCRLRTLYSTSELAIAGARQLRRTDPDADRLHVARASLGADGTSVAGFNLDYLILGYRSDLSRASVSAHANRSLKVIWHEIDDGPESVEYQRMLAEMD